MAINELPTAPASNMTQEQRRKQEAAILGIPAGDPGVPALTFEQIEFMRTQVAKFDAATMPREFDLNNPPRVPYRHQEYPKTLYHHEDRVARVVKSREQEDGLIGLGYVREPFPPVADPGPQLDPITLAEIAKLDAELKRKKQATAR